MPRIAPWISVADATRAVEFYKAAFGAVEQDRFESEPGRVEVAELTIGDATFWVQRDEHASAEAVSRSPVRMIVIVDDPDERFARAVAAGAAVVAQIHEGHGWRVGRIADPFGHQWELGRRLPPR